jgi:hypothetical protein
MNRRDFNYRIGDLLVWCKTNSLCVVTHKTPDVVQIQIVEGGTYPDWVGENRGYYRESLRKNVDFRIFKRAQSTK